MVSAPGGTSTHNLNNRRPTMEQRRSSMRTATKRSLGEDNPDYNDASRFSSIFQERPTARRRSSAKDAAQTTPSASRKRSGGAGSSVTKSESEAGDSIEVLPASETDPPATERINFERSDEPDDSDLSELGTTPDCPTPNNYQSQDAPDLASQLAVVSEQLSNNVFSSNHKSASPEPSHADLDRLPTKSADSAAIVAPVPSPISPQDLPRTLSSHVEPVKVSDTVAHEDASNDLSVNSGMELPPSQPVMPEPAPKAKQTLKLKMTPRPPKAAAAQSLTAPLTPSSLRQSGRSRTQPSRLGDPIPTSSAVAEEQLALQDQDESVYDGDSPTVQKVSRSKNTGEAGTKPGRRKPQPSVTDKNPIGDGTTSKTVRGKKPVSQEKLSLEDLADDVQEPRLRACHVVQVSSREVPGGPTSWKASTDLGQSPLLRLPSSPMLTSAAKAVATQPSDGLAFSLFSCVALVF